LVRILYSYQPFGYSGRLRGVRPNPISPLQQANHANVKRIEAVEDYEFALPRYVIALFFCLAGSVITCGRHATDAEPAALLKHAARLFEDLSRRSENTIPDAVLNRTRCVAVIPAIPTGTGNISRRGLATCREASDHWNALTFITFEENGGSKHNADLLIFILKDAAVRALRSGRLEIQRQKHVVAPLIATTAIPTQVELSVELLTYEYAGNVLSGSAARGVLRQDVDKGAGAHASDQALSHVSKKITEQYLSSLTSFFNTITPTGIVIHHTAMIPGNNALPRSERDVDKYHETRGFEITCFGHIYHAAYHYIILTNGRVQAGRPERCEGAHAEGYNSYLGISIVGDFDSQDNPTGKKGAIKPSEKQIASLVQLCRRLKDRYHIPLQHIVRHSDISSTRCPGDRFPFNAFLQQLQTTTASR
jgi:N-acetylmuramoyl-L-alanine amidase